MPTQPSRKLETFPNPEPGRDYLIRHECPEFTAVCPMTGQPDFGTIIVLYTPDRLCVELKSLKLYLWSFRNEGHYFEQVTNQILDDLVKAVARSGGGQAQALFRVAAAARRRPACCGSVTMRAGRA